MTKKLELSLAIDRHDRVAPIINGRVVPEGIEINPFVMLSPERHRRMLNHAEFDICELSFASYLATAEKEYPFTAIPVFTHRVFRHAYFFMNTSSGIEEPEDLEGKRIGLRRWQNTAGLWMRGIAQDYYGIDLTSIEWYVDDQDEVPVEIPEEFSVQWIDPDDNLNDMLVEGTLDAALYPNTLTAFSEGRSEVDRLFSDPKSEELAYYRNTGLFPIMHVIVIRDAVVEDHPWVPMSLLKAFDQSKQIVLDELDHAKPSLVWAQLVLEEQREVLGEDLWPSGIEKNRSDLEAVIRYAHTNGLLSKRVDPESLFFESSIEDLPEYV